MNNPTITQYLQQTIDGFVFPNSKAEVAVLNFSLNSNLPLINNLGSTCPIVEVEITSFKTAGGSELSETLKTQIFRLSDN